jgi:hypothetical protein
MWRGLRIGVLLAILAAVIFHTALDRRDVKRWRSPLWVGVFPIAGDGQAASGNYVRSLTSADLGGIDEFLRRESKRNGGPAEPARIQLYPGPHPPLPPRGDSNGPVANGLWSLRLRWYAWRRMQAIDGPAPRVRIFVVYHDPARTVKVPHSVGLEKGLLGVVHAFADHNLGGENQIVIAHELLHTLGASDKYDARNQPVYPEGYAEPAQEPRFPQRRAEVMAGRRALTADTADMPTGLETVVVGAATAREIGWASP